MSVNEGLVENPVDIVTREVGDSTLLDLHEQVQRQHLLGFLREFLRFHRSLRGHGEVQLVHQPFRIIELSFLQVRIGAFSHGDFLEVTLLQTGGPIELGHFEIFDSIQQPTQLVHGLFVAPRLRFRDFDQRSHACTQDGFNFPGHLQHLVVQMIPDFFERSFSLEEFEVEVALPADVLVAETVIVGRRDLNHTYKE
jgi:hypothetical protein